MRRILALLLVLALIGVSAPYPASSASTAVQVGASAGSAFGTMIYAPVKATFCILGGIGAGFTAIFSPPTAGHSQSGYERLTAGSKPITSLRRSRFHE